MLQRATLALLNHLTVPEGWATERLRPHAGQVAEIDAGPIRLRLGITHEGLFGTGEAESDPDVRISLGNDFPVRFLVDRARAFATARIAGKADFAETLAFVLRNLRWDAEADLAPVVGDIAARRLVMAGEGVLAWQRQALHHLADNLAEYARDEARWLASRPALETLRRDTHDVRDGVERLEKRLRQLERRAANA